ncbi:copper homeostasis protein CutC [Aerococcaceae bacterium NML190073]|nr:copper homeostasis protein CutC [Aerococcaceae bacterium NML190073]
MLLEVCAGSVQDCLTAQEAGAHRIELNSALHLGGLTSSLGMLLEAKRQVELPIICMVRPRGAGFHYNAIDIAVMFRDAQLLLEHGADGLAFGFLQADGTVDTKLTRKMVELCQQFGAEAVFHRAFDCTPDAEDAVAQLIECEVTRILTSGQAATASEGVDLLAHLQCHYGQQIDFCMGAGVNEENIVALMQATGIQEAHGSFKHWQKDTTTAGNGVDYSYGVAASYDAVSLKRVRAAADRLQKS